MKQKLSFYIADFFASKGVIDIFTVTGGGAMHLNDAFGHHPQLNCIYNHHEQASAIAAEGYARAAHKIPVVCVTSGPGGTNAITGVTGAWLDSIPMFVVSGQVKCETTIHNPKVPKGLRQLGDQEFDIINSVSNMTKYAVFVNQPNDILYHLEKAWFLANNGRKGPVWIDIPLDVQAAIVETEDLRHFNDSQEYNDLNEIENPAYDKKLTHLICEKIIQSKRPVIMLGSGVGTANARELCLTLAEKLQIPVVRGCLNIDVIDNENPLYCGTPGTIGLRGGNFVVQNADMIIVLGCRLNIRQISYNYDSWAGNAYKIVVDIDDKELHKPTVKPDMAIHANLVDVVGNLLDSLKTYNISNIKSQFSDWLKWSRNIHLKYPATLTEYYNDKLLNPYCFISEFSKRLKNDDVIVSGNGSACVMVIQALDVKKRQTYIANSGCAAMGYGFPAAIGAAVSCKNKRVICFDGDGSFQMNIQEMQTLFHYNLNVKVIYLNNNGYHSIRQTQKNLFQPPLVGVCAGNGVSFPDMSKIAVAYGLPYIKIDKLSEIENIINFIDNSNPAFCEIILDENQNFAPKLSSKVLPDGKIISPEINDMYPFLSREEYESNRVK